MGILGLFRTLVDKYSNTLNCNLEYSANYLFLDYNSLIHGVRGNYLTYSNPDITKIAKMSKTTLENNIIKEVINYTKHIVDYTKPDTLLYIAIDGSVPFAKMHLQRERRYKKGPETAYKMELQEKHGINEPELWDSDNITPGTKFMDKLSKELKKSIKKGIFSDHGGDNFKIILSDSYVPGEGETKIFHYLRNESIIPDGKICIYGLDADLIMLSIASKYNNIQLVREKQMSDIENELYADCELIYFNIDNLVSSLVSEYNLQDLDMDRFINDFIFITCLAGNDFVKNIYWLSFNKNPSKDAWNILLSIYLDIKNNTQDYLVIDHRTTQTGGVKKNNSVANSTNIHTLSNKSYAKQANSTNKLFNQLPIGINQVFFMQIIDALADKEQYALRGKQMSIDRYKDKPNEMQRNAELTPYQADVVRFEHTTYYDPNNPFYEKYRPLIDSIDYGNRVNNKKQYYMHFFGLDPNNVEEYNRYRQIISYHYIESLMWTINYYLGDIVAWGFYYKCRVAPFVSDIRFNLRGMHDINTFFNFELGEPYKPLHQLMMVLPPKSKSLLPTKYGDLMTNPKSKISKYYPKTFELDVVAGLKHYKSHAILPYLDDAKIITELDKVDKTIATSDKKRNILKTEYEEF
jgi:5'-3' exonuclease